MPASETNITWIAQVTFKFVNKALLIHNRRLSFIQFEILFDLVTNTVYRPYGVLNLVAKIFKLDANDVC